MSQSGVSVGEKKRVHVNRNTTTVPADNNPTLATPTLIIDTAANHICIMFINIMPIDPVAVNPV